CPALTLNPSPLPLPSSVTSPLPVSVTLLLTLMFALYVPEYTTTVPLAATPLTALWMSLKASYPIFVAGPAPSGSLLSANPLQYGLTYTLLAGAIGPSTVNGSP